LRFGLGRPGSGRANSNAELAENIVSSIGVAAVSQVAQLTCTLLVSLEERMWLHLSGNRRWLPSALNQVSERFDLQALHCSDRLDARFVVLIESRDNVVPVFLLVLVHGQEVVDAECRSSNRGNGVFHF
jgi:hypothetical protein